MTTAGGTLNVEAPTREQLNPLERALLGIECAPWHALYRMAIGWFILPAFFRLFGRNAEGYALFLFFGGVLLLLRIGPVVLRKVFPFSKQAQDIWFERRKLSKVYDSYQWRKLLWLGLGMAAYSAYSRYLEPANTILVALCIVGGVIGLWRWRGFASSGKLNCP